MSEKPVHRIEEIVDCARKHKKVFFVGFQRRFDPAFINARSLCMSDAAIRSVTIVSKDPGKLTMEWLLIIY